MKEYICKKQKQGKIIGSVGVVLLVALLALFIIGAVTDIKAFVSAGFGCFVVCIPLLVIFFEVYQPMISSYNYLQKHNLLELVEDINPDEVNLRYSKICLGKRAFLSKRSKVVIPYSKVLWVYIQVVRTYGIKSDEKVYIGCRDGKWFSIKAERQELPQLLEIIASHSPDLILGYGDEQNKRYYEAVKKLKTPDR